MSIEYKEKNCDICNNIVLVKKDYVYWDQSKGCNRYRYCIECNNFLCDDCMYVRYGNLPIRKSSGYFPELVHCLHHFIKEEHFDLLPLIKKYIDYRDTDKEKHQFYKIELEKIIEERL